MTDFPLPSTISQADFPRENAGGVGWMVSSQASQHSPFPGPPHMRGMLKAKRAIFHLKTSRLMVHARFTVSAPRNYAAGARQAALDFGLISRPR